MNPYFINKGMKYPAGNYIAKHTGKIIFIKHSTFWGKKVAKTRSNCTEFLYNTRTFSKHRKLMLMYYMYFKNNFPVPVPEIYRTICLPKHRTLPFTVQYWQQIVVVKRIQ